MRHNFFFILIIILSFSLSNASAQDASVTPKTISGGVLNGKATNLPKPSYPAAARAANVGGAVLVQVTVDENGDVVSATAVSGHPLLRQACEQAALVAKFAPTKLSGQLVKITGTLVYNFVPAMSFPQIGYELSLAENTRSISKSRLNRIRGSFPQNWEAERESVKKLDSLLTDKTAKEETDAATNSGVAAQPENKIVAGAGRTIQGDELTFKGVKTVKGDSDFSSADASEKTYSLGDDSITVINELQSKLGTRLGVNENIIWSFKLGTILGRLKAEITNEEKTRANLSELNRLNADKPAGISEAVTAKLKELTEVSKKTATVSDRQKDLLPLVESLRDSQ